MKTYAMTPILMLCLSAVLAPAAQAQDDLAMQDQPASQQRNMMNQGDYTLGPGDAIRVLVFQNPDLTLDTRVSESGTITYPLIGSVKVGGMPIPDAEKAIADALKKGGFVQQPQVNIVLVQVRGNQVAVLGAVNRPGRFPLETFNTRLSEMLANAGGILTGVGGVGGGSDTVIITGWRNGQHFRKEVDVPSMFLKNKPDDDIDVAAGDVIYVPEAPVYYIYGETQRPGAFRIQRGMSVQQALAMAGGPTLRGTERGMKIYRKGGDGNLTAIKIKPNDPVQANDVIYVDESLF
jgi:polysaccharide export outer membrane protein